MSLMLSDAYQQRFSGIARLYGRDAQHLFANSHICVIGIGGVGSWVAEALARTGIGSITMIDMDDICMTNTNRQIHALRQHIGQPKTHVMAERIYAINPECQVTCIDDFITPDNIAEYLTPHFDYVIDAIDSVRSKAALLFWCRRNKQPVITIGGAGGQIDPTCIKVTDLAKTVQDPLAAKLRARLKSDYKMTRDSKGKLGIDCVYSTEQLLYPQMDGSVCNAKQNAQGNKRMDCASGFGAVTMVTASFGFVAVSHVLKKMLAKMQRNTVIAKK